MFELTRKSAELAHLNVRSERHGEDKVNAADLKIVIEGSNDILSLFSPGLKAAFYRANDVISAQSQPSLVDTPDHMPVRQFPEIKSVKHGAKLAGATAILHYGVSGDMDVTLEDSTIDAFVLTMKDGGTVKTQFRVKCRPSPEQMSEIYKLLEAGDIEVSVVPPVDGQMELDDDEGNDD